MDRLAVMDSEGATRGAKVPALSAICQHFIVRMIKQMSPKCYGRLINDICKYVPNHLTEPILEMLLDKGLITEYALMSFLVPSRHSLKLRQAVNIRNSIFKQIGYNCPDLRYIDLSDCSQVSNSVVRAILQGCPVLEDMMLNNCLRVTDHAFDCSVSPFESLVGCLTLESISLQGCPQITGEIIQSLNKKCKQLKYLNLSQCKNVKSPQIQEIFAHNQLQSLNLDFIDDISDEAFCHLQPVLGIGLLGPKAQQILGLQKLSIGKGRITDRSLYCIANMSALSEISLQWCLNITDAGVCTLTNNCPRLRLIDLKSCLITDDSLAAIGAQSKELRTLDLSWCNGFSIEGLQFLVPRKRSSSSGDGFSACPACTATGTRNSSSRHRSPGNCTCVPASFLRELRLVWCSQVDDSAIEVLRSLSECSLEEVSLSGSGVTKEGYETLKGIGITVR